MFQKEKDYRLDIKNQVPYDELNDAFYHNFLVFRPQDNSNELKSRKQEIRKSYILSFLPDVTSGKRSFNKKEFYKSFAATYRNL